MGQDKLLQAVSMCRGAGKLKIGFDATVQGIEKGAPLVLIAQDASDRTRRNIRRMCEDGFTQAVDIPRTQEDIEYTVGRRFAVAAVCDENFARLIERHIVDNEEANL